MNANLFISFFSPKLPEAEKYWYCPTCPIAQRWGQFKSVHDYEVYHSFENHALLSKGNETSPKGGLILETFSGWSQSPK